MAVEFEEELYEQIREMYKNDQHSRMFDLLGTIEPPHPIIGFYGSISLATSISCESDVDKVVDAFVDALDQAWVRYGANQQGPILRIVMDFSTAMMNKATEVSDAIGAKADEATDEINEITQMISMQSYISPAGQRNLDAHVADINARFNRMKDAGLRLYDAITAGYRTAFTHYVDLLADNYVYESAVKDFTKMMYDLSMSNSKSYPNNNFYKTEAMFFMALYTKMALIKSCGKYWATRQDEKDSLVRQSAELNVKMNQIQSEINEVDREIKRNVSLKEAETDSEKKVLNLQRNVSKLQSQLDRINGSLFGMFKSKEKATLIEKITQEKEAIEQEKKNVEAEHKVQNDKYDTIIDRLKEKETDLQNKHSEVAKQRKSIQKQLLREE